MSFCTAVNCMDGRTQLPVNEYLRRRFGADYVDTVTEAGPIGCFDPGADACRVRSIMDRVDISVNGHGSRAIAVVAHHDCAGNPVPYETQMEQLRRSVAALAERFAEAEVIGLWVDERWQVHEALAAAT